MPWRHVGLQDDQGDNGIRRARITEDGALVVSVAGGLGGGDGSGGGGSGGTNGVVTLGSITTTDKLQVSLAEILTNSELPVRIEDFPAGQTLSVSLDGITGPDQLTVRIAEALADLPVRIEGVTGTLPVEISNSGSIPVLMTNADPIDVQLANATPLNVEIGNTGSIGVEVNNLDAIDVKVDGTTPLNVQVGNSTPIDVEINNPGPIGVEVANASPIDVEIGNATPIDVEISNASPVPVSLSGQPVSVTVAGATGATTGPNAQTGFGGDPGAVTAPAADAVITNHYPATADKLHLIEVTAWLSEGTPLAADNYNMAFKFGGTTIAKIPVLAAVNMPITSRFYYMSAAGTPFGVHAAGAGSPGVKYNAFLTATRLV